MATKAKTRTEKKPDHDELIEEWVEEKPKKVRADKHEPKISNNALWVLFIVIFLGFITASLLAKAPPKEMQTTYINGVKISAYGDPVASLKSLASMHVVGKTFDESDDISLNALMEMGTVIGKSGMVTSGGEHTMTVGITARTGIFIGEKSSSVEGASVADLWTAVWTFNSIISDTPIQSDVALFKVQELLAGKKDVSLVLDLDNACSSYARIVSSASDIMQALGFWQAAEGYTINQYNESGDSCNLQFAIRGNGTIDTVNGPADCPKGDFDSFVVVMRGAESNGIIITNDGLAFQYASCDAMFKNSVMVRDLLAPDVLTGTRNFQLPTEI